MKNGPVKRIIFVKLKTTVRYKHDHKRTELIHFWPKFHISYLLKTLGNLEFSGVLRGYEITTLRRNGLSKPIVAVYWLNIFWPRLFPK